MLNKLFMGIRTYWLVILLGAFVIGLFVYVSNQQKDIKQMQSDVKTTQGLIRDANTTYAKINKPFDVKKHQKTIQERTVSAKQIGKEMIAVDDTLTAFFKTNEPLPKNEAEKKALLDRVKKAKQLNTRLTGASESDQIKTWQLNPSWTLTLDSILTYQDTDRVPVVFSMKTKVGKVAGLIVATYDVVNHKLLNVSRYYTNDGLKDEIDVGGV